MYAIGNDDGGLELSLLADEENQASEDNLPVAACVPLLSAVDASANARRQRNLLRVEQQNRNLRYERYFNLILGTFFVGFFIIVIKESNKMVNEADKKLREHEQNIYCFDLELINFTEQPLEFLRPRYGSDCSISPWKNIAPNATAHITRIKYSPINDYEMKCKFFISTDIALTAAVDGYDDDQYKHDIITAKGKDENNCEIKIHKLSDCSWVLFKKCPTSINDLALEYQTLSKLKTIVV